MTASTDFTELTDLFRGELLAHCCRILGSVDEAEDETTEPNDPVQRAILDRFTAAFENGDADALAELLRKDPMLEMPPLPGWLGSVRAAGHPSGQVRCLRGRRG